MRDGSQGHKSTTAIASVDAADNTLVTGLTIDTANFDSLTFEFNIGIMADAAATWVVTVYDDDASGMGTEAAVADAFLIGTEAAVSWDQADDAKVKKIGYIGPKRYVRVKVQPADNAGASPFSCNAVLGFARGGLQTAQTV